MLRELMNSNWKRLAFAFLVALIVGFGTNFYFLSNNLAKADQRDRWEGMIEQKVVEGEAKDKAIFSLMKEMREESQKGREEIMKKIDSICNDITEVKVQAARNGVMYGAGSGGGVLILLQLIQYLAKKKNAK